MHVQSIPVFVPINIVQFILAFIPIIGWIINIVLWILEFILWIFLMYNAYQGKMIKLPIAGNIAEKYANPPPPPQSPPPAPPPAPQ